MEVKSVKTSAQIDSKYFVEDKRVHDTEGFMWSYVLSMFKTFPIAGYGTEITITQELGKWITKLKRYRSCD